jgi:predicted acetyltransferase
VSTAAGLRLRPLRHDDEAAFRSGHQAMAAEGFTFGLGLAPGLAWSAYLQLLADQRAGLNLTAGLVPGTFLVADVDGEIVGRTSIRHELNDFLRRQGGHIGYGVLRQHRRCGYATEILRQSLVIARAAGVEQVLVCCDDDNTGSAAVIEACGGELDSVVVPMPAAAPVRRYWIG